MPTKKLTNIVASPHDARDYRFQPSGIAVPSMIDLRKYDTPIRNQAKEGSCVPHAILGAVENMVMRGASRSESLAPQFPYHVALNQEGRLGQEGTWIRDVLEVGRKFGFCREDEWPYTADDEMVEPSPAAYASAATRKIRRYESIPINPDDYFETIANLKAAITEASLNRGSTVIFAIKLTDQFFGLTGPLASQNYLGVGSTKYHGIGNHGMSLPAFDDHLNGGSFVPKNQWDSAWGDNGYCAIPYITMAADIIEAWIVRSFADVDMTDKDAFGRQTTVTQLYAAMFGRAPEASGLNYWVSQLASGRPVEQVAQSMYNCDPSRAYYPAGATSQQIIQKFYVNVLGRVPDAGGLAYWKGQLDSGKSQGQVIIDMINAVVGYAGTDAAALASQALFANKVAVGLYCGVDLACDSVNAASSLLPLVTADPASVETAKLHLRQMLSAGGLL